MKKYTIKVMKNYMQYERITILAKDKKTAIRIAKGIVKLN